MWRNDRDQMIEYSVILYTMNMILKLHDLHQTPLKAMILKEYHNLLFLLHKIIAEQFPVLLQNNYKIILQALYTSPFWPIYQSSRELLRALNEWILRNLWNEFIQSFNSQFLGEGQFTPSINGAPRVWVADQRLNDRVINNHCPVWLI